MTGGYYCYYQWSSIFYASYVYTGRYLIVTLVVDHESSVLALIAIVSTSICIWYTGRAIGADSLGIQY
jgi:hypothetical protein